MRFTSLREYVQDVIHGMECRDPSYHSLVIFDPSTNRNGLPPNQFLIPTDEAITTDIVVELLDAARLRGPLILNLCLENIEIDGRVGMALAQLFQGDDRQWCTVEIHQCSGSSLESCLPFIALKGNVQELRLIDNSLSYPGFCNIAMILASNKMLSTLELHNDITVTLAHTLSWGLQSNTTLRNLSMLCRFLDGESLAVLLEGIRRHPYLEGLDLSECELNDSDCAFVMNSISGHPTLATIDLSSNFFSHRAMEATAACLKDNRMPNLTTLMLSECSGDMEPLPIGILGPALKSNTRLQELNLSFGNHPPTELRDMMEGVRSSHLVCLYLDCCLHNNQHLDIILSNLPKSIRTLSLNVNSLTEKNITIILETLNRHQTIKTLDFNDFPCWEEKVKYLLRLNRGGRQILSTEIPLSFWPLILTRVNTIALDPHNARGLGYREDVLFYYLKAIAPYILQQRR